MAVIGGMIVLLLGLSLVLLGALWVRLGQLAATAEAAERKRTEEDRKHRDAVGAVVVAAVREVGRAIVQELQRAADERRETVRRLVGAPLGPDSEPTRAQPSPRSAVPLAWTAPPAPRCASTSLRASAKPDASPLPSEAPTPRSGYPLADLFAHPEVTANDTAPHA